MSTIDHDVVVVGEALMDIVTSDAGTAEHPGGSPANVAYGLARLGVDTGLFTSLGSDTRGTAIQAHLTKAGVSLLPGSLAGGRTSSATAALAPDGSARYDFDITWDLPPLRPAMRPRVLHTGSIASFLAPGAGVVRTLLEQAQGESLVTYDPNIRPALLGSHAQALAIFEDLVPLADVVKLSDEDAGWLYPGRPLEEAAGHVLDLGARLAVVTRGSEGSLMVTSGTRHVVPVRQSSVVDTIGAGDSYMAALVFGLLTVTGSSTFRPEALEQIGLIASTAASITVGREGANPPSAGEVFRRIAMTAASTRGH